jgi:hypothetical protein
MICVQSCREVDDQPLALFARPSDESAKAERLLDLDALHEHVGQESWLSRIHACRSENLMTGISGAKVVLDRVIPATIAGRLLFSVATTK